MFDCSCESLEIFFEVDIDIDIKIIFNSCKHRMFLLFDSDDKISCLFIRMLLWFFFKNNLLVMLSTCWNFKFYSFLLLCNFLSFADRTIFTMNMTFPPTFRTCVLHLHLHHPHLYRLINSPLSITLRTLLNLAILCSCTMTSITNLIPLNRNRMFFSFIKFF